MISRCKPRLLVVSHVLPFPGASGQQQRVRHMLCALRESFHLTFLTTAPRKDINTVQTELKAYCDQAICISSLYGGSKFSRFPHRGRAALFGLRSGLKFSNYRIGELEFSPERLASVLDGEDFDLALFEYWHAHQAAPLLQSRGIPCVLDMHDILWQSYRRQLSARRLPQWWRQRQVRCYRKQEEAAWERYDALITINTAEHDYVKERIPGKPLFYAPMGIDMQAWPYRWQPATPPRIAYYGGLGSPHNQRYAVQCYREIMPLVWVEHPDVEFWIIGSRPPGSIRRLEAQDSRVRVTGFVKNVEEILGSMSVLLCPWTGRYGFRSRLVEAMALGVPVVATPDAVHGMGLEDGKGVFLANNSRDFADFCLIMLQDPSGLKVHSRNARTQVEERYSFQATYGAMADELRMFVNPSAT